MPIGKVQDDRNLAAKPKVGDLRNRRGKRGGDAPIHGIAAAQEHAQTSFGREVPAGCEHTDLAGHVRPVCPRSSNAVSAQEI